MTASHMAASSASIVLLLFERCAPRCLARPPAGRFAGTTCDELGAISGARFATGLATGLAVRVRVRARARARVRVRVRARAMVRVTVAIAITVTVPL